MPIWSGSWSSRLQSGCQRHPILPIGPSWLGIGTRLAYQSRPTWRCATTWVTPKWGFPTFWITTRCRKPVSKPVLGSHSLTSSVTKTASCFCALFSPHCALKGRFTRADPYAKKSRLDVSERWRIMASHGLQCWTATNSPWITTCASHLSQKKQKKPKNKVRFWIFPPFFCNSSKLVFFVFEIASSESN